MGHALTGARVWRDGQLVSTDVEPKHLAEALKDDSTLVWVDLLDPSPEHLTWLAEDLGLGATVVEDALAPRERAKVSRHDDALFFTVYATHLSQGPDAGVPAEAGAGPAGEVEATAARVISSHADGHGHIGLARVSGFVLPRGLVTIRLSGWNGPDFDMAPVVRRWEESPELLCEGTPALLYGLLDVVVDGHFETIQAFDDALESLEDKLFEESRTGADFTRSLYGMRKDLVALRRVVLPMREVVNGLLRHRGRTGGPLDAWYDDLYDHVLRASEWTESLRDMVTTVFETNLSLQDARLNTVMKQLAAWAAIIAVPTAVTGWFGQNVPYPGFQHMSGLWMSIGLIVALSAWLYWVFRRRDWL